MLENQHFFTAEEEEVFKGHFLTLTELGIPIGISPSDIRIIVNSYLVNKNISNFKNNMPRLEWCQL